MESNRIATAGRASLPACIVSALAFCTLGEPLDAANRFFIEPGALEIGPGEQEIFVRCDNERALGSLSFLIGFDASVIELVKVEEADILQPGAWTNPWPAAKLAEANARGQVLHFPIFGLDLGADPPVFDGSRVLSAGNGRDLLRLTVKVLAAAPTRSVLRFLERNPFFPHPQEHIQWNVMSILEGEDQGISILPPELVLEERTIDVGTIEPPAIARVLQLGDTVSDGFGGRDRVWYVFEAPPGALLSLSFKSSTKAGPGSYRLDLFREVPGPAGEALDLRPIDKGSSVLIKNLLLTENPIDARFYLRVLALTESPSAFRIQLKTKLPKAVLSAKTTLTAAAGQPNPTLEFIGLPGASLKAVVKGIGVDPDIVGLRAPGGAEIPLGTETYVPGVKAEKLKQLSLAAFGPHALEVAAALGELASAQIAVTLAIKPAKKRAVTDPGALPGVELAFGEP